MNLLIIDINFHHKNKIGLNMILSYTNGNYKYGSIDDIGDYDIIYSPSVPINTALYPNKKFIFGPHFSVFPTINLLNINNIHNNSIYIQPSEWACQIWKNMNAENVLPLHSFPFPVEIEKFQPTTSNKTKVFIYFKSRKCEELNLIETFLKSKNIDYKIFDYRRKYSEKDYIKYLQETKYGIWLGRHESQGFALQEALSINVPLLVWDVESMNQEEGYNYPNIFGTVIPYFDKTCGEYFYKGHEFETKYNEFISKLDTYKPREYILENLSVEKCAEKLNKLIRNI